MAEGATYRAEVIGSLLRPAAVKDVMAAAAAGAIGPDELARVQEAAIDEAVARQEACGLDTITDGEFRRQYFWDPVIASLDGFAADAASPVFLAAPGVLAAGMAIHARSWRSRWAGFVAAMGATALVGLGLVRLLMNPVDRVAVIDNGGLGGALTFPETYRLYYLNWLKLNLGTGFLLLAILGTVWLIVRERRSGVYTALAFWAPQLSWLWWNPAGWGVTVAIGGLAGGTRPRWPACAAGARETFVLGGAFVAMLTVLWML